MRRTRNDATHLGQDRQPHESQTSYPESYQWAHDEALNFEQFSDGGQSAARLPMHSQSAQASSAGLPDDISELLAMLVSRTSCL